MDTVTWNLVFKYAMDYQIAPRIMKSKDGSLEVKITFFSYLNHIMINKLMFYSEIGFWHAGVTPKLSFNPNMKEKISFNKAKKVLKIVTVIQPPFVYSGIMQ